MKLEKLNLTVVTFPKKADRLEYFKAAVLYILTDGDVSFEYAKENEMSTLDDGNVKAIIKEAVPGHNSTLLNLEIMSNVNKHIIKDETLSLDEKIARISRSIKKYVLI